MDYFSHLSLVNDPRQSGKIIYPLDFLLLIIFSGCQEFDEMEDYCERYSDSLLRVYKAMGGDAESIPRMPSHDTLNRLMQGLNPKEFHASYLAWVSGFYEKTTGRLIHLDGKTMRGVKRGAYPPTHIVSTYASDEKYVLAQEAIIARGGELASFERLLQQIDLEGAIVTMDAAGTYRHICCQIVEAKGDFVLQVKRNQPKLLEEIEAQFRLRGLKKECFKEEDFGHGRLEKREVTLISDLSKWMEDVPLWEGIKSIVRVKYATTSLRTRKARLMPIILVV